LPSTLYSPCRYLPRAVFTWTLHRHRPICCDLSPTHVEIIRRRIQPCLEIVSQVRSEIGFSWLIPRLTPTPSAHVKYESVPDIPCSCFPSNPRSPCAPADSHLQPVTTVESTNPSPLATQFQMSARFLCTSNGCGVHDMNAITRDQDFHRQWALSPPQLRNNNSRFRQHSQMKCSVMFCTIC
jgi:hypothetical protein